MFTKLINHWIKMGRWLSLFRVTIIGGLMLGIFALPSASAYAADCQTWHTVQRGETLYRIGLKYNFTWDRIAAANGLKSGDKIYAGQKLCIPKAATTTTGGSGKPAPDVVVVLGTNVKRVLALTDVNVRVGPSMEYKIVGKVVTDQTVKVTGLSSDSLWWRVECPQGSGANDCWITARARYTRPA
jgi:LysM repeat protein